MQYEELGIHDMNDFFPHILFGKWLRVDLTRVPRAVRSDRPAGDPSGTLSSQIQPAGWLPLGPGPGRKISPTEPPSPGHRRRLQSQIPSSGTT